MKEVIKPEIRSELGGTSIEGRYVIIHIFLIDIPSRFLLLYYPHFHPHLAVWQCGCAQVALDRRVLSNDSSNSSVICAEDSTEVNSHGSPLQCRDIVRSAAGPFETHLMLFSSCLFHRADRLKRPLCPALR